MVNEEREDYLSDQKEANVEVKVIDSDEDGDDDVDVE